VKQRLGLVGILSINCTIQLLIHNFPECDPGPPIYKGEVSVNCEDGEVVNINCAPDLCEPRTGLCRGIACGDGLVDPSEQCDDGNNVSRDGCNTLCLLEFCGDDTLQLDLAEECDDGNAINGEGCDIDCQLEIIVEVERNDDDTPDVGGVVDDTGAENVIVGDDFSASNANGPFLNAIISATFEPIGGEDIFEVVNPNTFDALLSVKASAGNDFVACVDLDTSINLRSIRGALLASDDDIEGVSNCSRSSDFALGPGEPVFVHITAFPDDVAHSPYFLRIVTTP
jgi:cysteine-rich repeat protein